MMNGNTQSFNKALAVELQDVDGAVAISIIHDLGGQIFYKASTQIVEGFEFWSRSYLTQVVKQLATLGYLIHESGISGHKVEINYDKISSSFLLNQQSYSAEAKLQKVVDNTESKTSDSDYFGMAMISPNAFSPERKSQIIEKNINNFWGKNHARFDDFFGGDQSIKDQAFYDWKDYMLIQPDRFFGPSGTVNLFKSAERYFQKNQEIRQNKSRIGFQKKQPSVDEIAEQSERILNQLGTS
jgi:hypothetical protein